MLRPHRGRNYGRPMRHALIRLLCLTLPLPPAAALADCVEPLRGEGEVRGEMASVDVARLVGAAGEAEGDAAPRRGRTAPERIETRLIDSILHARYHNLTWPVNFWRGEKSYYVRYPHHACACL